MVKIVDAELSIEARELMTAPLIAAKMNARTPGVTKFFINNGYAASVPLPPII